MSAEHNPQLAAPPAEVIRRELEARGWTQFDLAMVLGVNPSLISHVMNGKRPITLELARDLAAALGRDPGYWISLDANFRLFSGAPNDGSVARRARIFEAAPITEMIKRRWIQATDDVDILEKQVLGFYGVQSLDEVLAPLPHAARKPGNYGKLTATERAWIHRVRQRGEFVTANRFSDASFSKIVEELQHLLAHPESVRHVPKLLAKAGIRLVIAEPLGRSRIDGVCLWLDKHSPVIGLSMRIDRLDSFWFTLWHELAHVKNRDGLLHEPLPDLDLTGENAILTSDKPIEEQVADEFASSSLVKPKEIDNFIARVAPLFSKARIKGFAARIRVHPAIVVGQLHHRRQIDWSQCREFLCKVRETLTQATHTDGWGHSLPAAG